MSKTIIIASGGTGGHLYPTIAIADEIKQLDPSARVVFVGTADRIEAKEVPRSGYDFRPISIEAPRKSIGSMVKFPFKMLKAVIDCIGIIGETKATAFLGGGAYLSVPVGIAAWIKGLRLGLLEINSIGGSANRLLSRFAKRIFLAYPESKKDFANASDRLEVSGTPVRHNLGAELNPAAARQTFGLDPAKPTILVFGGSLGAKAINEAMADAAAALADQGYNIIWQTGKSANVSELKAKVQRANVHISEYIYEMDKAYTAADLVVARAGASTLAELSQIGKAAILVPYPFAADNHQEHNARAYEQEGAAIVLRDQELKEKLLGAVEGLMRDASSRERMAQAMRKRENKRAARIVAEWLLAN
ncbi:MAG TPA: undecaprenyldiphospho-muramoylpentapeptide beta-N-acetylglucosaminyltransferase [Candidatus Kapabacteria bacterium]|nr:undecaprenyldiphospho-muramoylpentapeptide beta-N-acetylglucosaminyltransferase [Candidatus Kapabacteria bacterium]